MVKRRRIGVALLAAGASRRFGEADKLAQPLRGRPLGEHAGAAIPRERLALGWVIVSGPDHPCEPGWRAMDFDPVLNPKAAQGMGTSVALAARLAQQARLDALVIALADMPLVPGTHYEALIGAVANPEDIATSARGEARMPPAVFGAAHFASLAKAGGDIGARKLLARGYIVPCPPEWLIDIDTPEALAGLA